MKKKTTMDGNMMVLFIVLVLGIAIKETAAVQVEVDRKEILVLPGQNATFMCRLPVPLQYCRAVIPGFSKGYNLNKGTRDDSEVTYYGEGLEAGQCGFTIRRVEDKNNGQVSCTVGLQDRSEEFTGTMQLIVASPPKQPELDLSRGTDSLRVYKVKDILQASCIVRDGRPVANISWFLDDEVLGGEDLSMPTVVDIAKENLQSKIQNLTRVLRATDNGKFLRCVAYHPAYPHGFAETKRQLDIKYAPLPKEERFVDLFGYSIGKVGVINLTIEANPRPQIEWYVDGQNIREGGNDNTGRIEAETARDLGNGRYLVALRIAAINKQDTEKDYILKAYNDMGHTEYKIKISTNPEPKGLDLGIGSIIGIVVAILLVVLVVSIVIFARMTGRWCFSGNIEGRHLGESSDTESADVRPKEGGKRNLPPIKLTSFFKKNKDKPLTEQDPEEKRQEIEDEDRISTTEAEEPIKDTPPTETRIENEKTETKTNSPGKEIPKQNNNGEKKEKDGIVYAELDLLSPQANLKPVVKNDDEKTEYAEIVYKPKESGKNEENGKQETKK